MSTNPESAFGGKIIFFGTSNVALPILEALRKQFQILAVVTTPDSKVGRKQQLAESPVSALATDLKLPLLKPEQVKNNPDFLAELQKFAADIFVVVSYGKILPSEVINLPPFKTINVHFSPLPKYRGASPMQAALLSGDEYTGISVFILDEEVDHGPLLAQEIVKIDPGDNFFTLSDKLARQASAMICGVVLDYTAGKIESLPQDESMATFTQHISKADGQIGWNKTAWEIYNQFRAFYPWPGIWTKWNGKIVKITDCAPVDQEAGTNSVGTVLGAGQVLCAGNSVLEIRSLQLEGKNEVAMPDFLNGYKDFVGSILE